MSISRNTMIWTAVGAVAAVLALIFAIAVQSKDKNPPDRNTANGGVCAQAGNYNTCTVSERLSDIKARAEDDKSFRQEASKFSGVDPATTGPWPFVVLDTDVRGLKARSSDEKDGVQIGSAANRTVLWVDCASTSSFDADPATGSGPRWLRIKWPNSEPTTQFFTSEPGQTGYAYVFRYYAVPLGHNGQIALC
jgi:hypothetical protein